MSLVENYKKFEEALLKEIEGGDYEVHKIMHIFGRYRTLLLNINMSGYTAEGLNADENIPQTEARVRRIEKRRDVKECSYEKSCIFHGVSYLNADNEVKRMCEKKCIVAGYFDFEDFLFEKEGKESIFSGELSELLNKFDELVAKITENGKVKLKNSEIVNFSDYMRIIRALSEYEIVEYSRTEAMERLMMDEMPWA